MAIATAALGYYADQRHTVADAGESQAAEIQAQGIAEKLAALEEWKAAAVDDIKAQSQELAELRVQVAVLRDRAHRRPSVDDIAAAGRELESSLPQLPPDPGHVDAIKRQIKGGTP